MVNKVNLSLIESEGTGQVISDAAGLSVKVSTPDDSTLSGNYDRTNGAITLNIPNIGRLVINGLPTVNDIGYGEQGLPGDEGRDGVDGLMGRDGLRGVDGCPGPRGPDGKQGKQGPQGQRGAQGFRGEPGPTGPTGADGVFSVYVQDNDPTEDQEVKPGTIWVRP